MMSLFIGTRVLCCDVVQCVIVWVVKEKVGPDSSCLCVYSQGLTCFSVWLIYRRG